MLEAPWFKSSQRLCAYISCAALREVDTSKVLAEILQGSDKGVFFLRESLVLGKCLRVLVMGCLFDCCVVCRWCEEKALCAACGGQE